MVKIKLANIKSAIKKMSLANGIKFDPLKITNEVIL